MIFDPISLQKYRLIYLKLRAVSSSNRFYLLSVINNQDSINVGQLVEFTNMDQPIISQHLAVLKKAGMVDATALKKERFYSINKKEVEKLISFAYQLKKENTGEIPLLKNAYPILLEAYKYFKFLLHPGRLVLVELIDRNGASSVNELAELSSQSQSIASQNLKLLTQLNIITKKEEGRKTIYALQRTYLDYMKSLAEKFT